MKLSFDTKKILAALKLFSSTGNPALGATILTSEDKLQLVDLTQNIYLESKIDFKLVDGEAKDFTFPLGLVTEILASLKDGDITFEISEDDQRLLIKHKNGEYKIRLMLTTQPGTTGVLDDSIVLYEDTQKEVIDLLKRMQYAVAVKDLRPILQGICLTNYIDNKTKVFCATDAYRLATFGIVPEEIGDKDQYVLPAELLKLIPKVDTKKDEQIQVLTDSNESLAILKTDNLLFYIPLLQGVFPPFEKLLPKNEDLKIKLTIEKEVILSSLQRIKPLISKQAEGSVTLTFKEDKLVLTANNSDNSEGREEIDLNDKISPPKFSISLRLSHFTDAINSFPDEDTVIIYLQEQEGKPVVLKSDKRPEQLSLTMPS